MQINMVVCTRTPTDKWVQARELFRKLAPRDISYVLPEQEHEWIMWDSKDQMFGLSKA